MHACTTKHTHHSHTHTHTRTHVTLYKRRCVCFEMQDDEETLAAEEALAAQDQQAGGRGEMDELDEEANLPIEELMARCV